MASQLLSRGRGANFRPDTPPPPRDAPSSPLGGTVAYRVKRDPTPALKIELKTGATKPELVIDENHSDDWLLP